MVVHSLNLCRTEGGGGSDVEIQAGGWCILAGLAMIAFTNGGRAQLKRATEDRADPNPHQVSLGVELAGLCLGVVISWSQRLRSGID
jgi:hypothetical protein